MCFNNLLHSISSLRDFVPSNCDSLPCSIVFLSSISEHIASSREYKFKQLKSLFCNFLLLRYQFCVLSKLKVQHIMKRNNVQKEFWYLGAVQVLLYTYYVSTCLYFIKPSSSPVGFLFQSSFLNDFQTSFQVMLHN